MTALDMPSPESSIGLDSGSRTETLYDESKLRRASVYVFENDKGEVKIGWAVSPRARLALIQAGNAHDVWLAYEKETSLPVARRVETMAHLAFREKRIGAKKEWFAVSSANAQAKVASLIEEAKLDECRVNPGDFVKSDEKQSAIGVRLPTSLVRTLEREARRRERSVAYMLRFIVSDWIASGGSISSDERPIVLTKPEKKDA